MARPRKYTDEQFIQALGKTRGMVYHAAELLGCEADTIHNRAKVSEAVAAALRKERGKIVDTAESKLFGYVEDGEAWAIQFALRNLGKDRGYFEKSEVEQRTTSRLVIEEDVVGDGDAEGEAAPGAG